jgi:predicted secreted protein
MATGAFAALGFKLQHKISGSFVTVTETLSIEPPKPTRDEIEVTSLDTVGGYREYILSFKNPGELKFTANRVKGDASQASLISAFGGTTAYDWRIIEPAGDVVMTFKGLIKELYTSGYEPSSQVKLEGTIKVSGEVTFTP